MEKKHIPVNSTLDEYAKKLRKNMTDEERILWYNVLRGRNPRFHRQKIIGNYIVDFYCPKLKLIIEIDGFHHYYDENIEYDNKRTEFLEKTGFYVLRFDNSDINKDFEYVRYTIDVICEARAKGLPIAPEYR